MKFKVMVAVEAVRDLEDIYEFILRSDSLRAADDVVSKVEKTIDKLGTYPERGRIPPELASLGSPGFREVVSKPYRLIYQVVGKAVYVMVVADGRRDMRTILEKRLLSPSE